MTELDVVAVVEELGRRFRAADRAGAALLLHPELRIEQPTSLPHGGWHDGVAGLGALGATFAEHWDRTIGPADVRASADDAAVQVTSQTWTSKATGRSATVDVVELIRVAEGRVVEIRVFPQDTAALLATLDPA